MNLAQILYLFCRHILPVYKCFHCQIHSLYFSKAVTAVMDVVWVITAGPLCPGKWVNIWFYNFTTHIPTFRWCAPLPSHKTPNQSYIKLTNKPWIALHCFVVPSPFPSCLWPLTSTPNPFWPPHSHENLTKKTTALWHLTFKFCTIQHNLLTFQSLCFTQMFLRPDHYAAGAKFI